MVPLTPLWHKTIRDICYNMVEKMQAEVFIRNLIKTRGSQEPDSLTWFKCLSRAINLTISCLTILTQEDFSRTIIRIISAIESFFHLLVFKILAENCKKETRHFSSFKGNNSYKESPDNFDPWRLLKAL